MSPPDHMHSASIGDHLFGASKIHTAIHRISVGGAYGEIELAIMIEIKRCNCRAKTCAFSTHVREYMA